MKNSKIILEFLEFLSAFPGPFIWDTYILGVNILKFMNKSNDIARHVIAGILFQFFGTLDLYEAYNHYKQAFSGIKENYETAKNITSFTTFINKFFKNN